MKPSTIECPSCALEHDAGLEVCPYCDYEHPRHRKGVPTAAWLFGLLMLLPLLWVLFNLF